MMKNEEKNTNLTTEEKTNRKWIYFLGGALIAAILVVAIVILYHKVHYGSRWYKNTYINGVDVSGQTLEESKKELSQEYKDYALKIKARDKGTLTIDGKDIDYVFGFSKDFDKLYKDQHESFRLFSKKENLTTNYNISYDKKKLKKLLKNSQLITGSDSYKITKSEDATVVYDNKKQQYVCKKEVAGNKLIKKEFLAAVEDAMAKANTTLDLTDSKKYPNVYKAPSTTSKDDIITTELDLCNNAALRYITWDMGKGVTEQITPVEISQWIVCKNGKIKYKVSEIEKWVEQFCLKYKTVGKTRKIKSHTGKTVKIYGGDYGWQLDYEKTLKQTKKALKKSIAVDATNAYIKDPSAENKKALTLNKKVIYLNTAYQKDYENFAVDWDTKNYTEIDLSAQKVYVFRKGKVAFTCRCISGRPVEGRRTPTGAFFIKEHRTEYTLTGANYATHVKNWVRITWTGTGFHPATWQPWSRWSSSLYKTRGSHGCINLSVPDSKKIYDLEKYREAVFIH